MALQRGDTGLSHVYASCINRHVWHAQMSVLHGDNWKGHCLNGGILIVQLPQGCACIYICRVQKLKCIVLSHACKHKPDSHIMPYWSDRVRRKLAENTNTAWGGSLKPETSLLSMVFFCSGNHLVAHAYQVLSQSLSLLSAFFGLCCLLQRLCNGGFKRTTRLKLPANLSNLCSLIIFYFYFFAEMKRICRHFCFTACLCHSAVWQGVHRCRSNFTLKL